MPYLEQRGISELSFHVDAQMYVSTLKEYIIESHAGPNVRYPWHGYANWPRIFPWNKQKMKIFERKKKKKKTLND